MPDETVEPFKLAKSFPAPVVKPEPEPEPEPEPLPSAAERLRDVEDEWFGKDETRINGKIQDGHGSKFALLSAGKKKHYHALQGAAEAEEAVTQAQLLLTEAHKHLAEAEKQVDATAEEADADGGHK